MGGRAGQLVVRALQRTDTRSNSAPICLGNASSAPPSIVLSAQTQGCAACTWVDALSVWSFESACSGLLCMVLAASESRGDLLQQAPAAGLATRKAHESEHR